MSRRVLAIFLLLAGLVALPALAQRHDKHDPGHWYDYDCCALNDCAPIPPSAIRADRNGYHVHIQPGAHPLVKEAPVSGFVSYPDARQSQDGAHHACIVAGKIKCLYAPQGGV